MSLRYLPHLIVMIFFSMVDVRVRAGGEPPPEESSEISNFSELSRVYREPEGCQFGQARCYQMVKKGPFRMSVKDQEWIYGQKSVVRWKAQETQLLKGRVTVKSESVVEFQTGTALVSFSGGRILVEKLDESVKVSNVSAKVVVTPRGKKQGFDLPKGFVVVVRNVGVGGFAQTDIVQAIDIKSLLKDWGELATNEMEFRNEALSFRQIWQNAVALASQWHQVSVERKIAAYEAKQELLRKRRAQREAENRQLRRLFRSKTGY